MIGLQCATLRLVSPSERLPWRLARREAWVPSLWMSWRPSSAAAGLRGGSAGASGTATRLLRRGYVLG